VILGRPDVVAIDWVRKVVDMLGLRMAMLLARCLMYLWLVWRDETRVMMVREGVVHQSDRGIECPDAAGRIGSSSRGMPCLLLCFALLCSVVG
jgi:hypothetical protein